MDADRRKISRSLWQQQRLLLSRQHPKRQTEEKTEKETIKETSKETLKETETETEKETESKTEADTKTAVSESDELADGVYTADF